jgi:hypothetical protein
MTNMTWNLLYQQRQQISRPVGHEFPTHLRKTNAAARSSTLLTKVVYHAEASILS